MCRRDIDRDAEAVRARAVRSGNRAAIVAPLAWPHVHNETVGQPGELTRNLLQRLGRAVDPAEPEMPTVLTRQPHDVRQSLRETGCPAIAVHLPEQRQIPRASGIEIDVRREAFFANRIVKREHILDVRIVENGLEWPGAHGPLAAVDAHAGAVLPDKVVAFNPIEEIRIGLEKGRRSVRGQALRQTCSALRKAGSRQHHEEEGAHDTAGQHHQIVLVVQVSFLAWSFPTIRQIGEKNKPPCQGRLLRNADVGGNAYLSWVETVLNVPLRGVPTEYTEAMITIDIPAAIRPYSIAVAPDSSFRNAKNVDM